MKILLVQQDTGRRKIKTPLYPLGLSYIATALRDHEVKIFDPNVYEYPDSFEKLKTEVASFKPAVVGISIRNIDTTQRRDLFVEFKTVRPMIHAIKEKAPNAKIMIGGGGYSIFAKEVMEKIPEADYGVYLEGEESTPELINNLDTPEKVLGIYYRKEGKVIFSGQRTLPDFSNIAMPCRDSGVIDIKNYTGPLHNVIGIQSKRGCLLKCSYCSYLFLNGCNIRMRPPVHVVDEIEYLLNHHGVAKFTFVDSVFNIPESHAKEICREIIKRNLKVEWGAWFSIHNLTLEFLELVKEAGCRHIGSSPDAATDKGLKGLRKGMTVKQIDDSMKAGKAIKDVAIGYNFFVAHPGQDFKGLLMTIYYMYKIPIMMPGRGGVGVGWIRIEPHTEIYQKAIEEGMMTDKTDLLPENEEHLKKLFYEPSSQRYITVIMHLVLFITEDLLKPMVKGFFRIVGRLRGKASLYDS